MNNNDRINLIHRISELEGLTDRERSALLGLLRESKTYGLVWEDKPEAVEERMLEELPVLREVPERALISDSKDAPNHILIEGDNLEALTTLAYTHAGRIDVIYIDPPYNTGNKDFVYNDSFVDREDTYRHSKWLSFMSRRLRIAKQLLSDKGVEMKSFFLKTLLDNGTGLNLQHHPPFQRKSREQLNIFCVGKHPTMTIHSEVFKKAVKAMTHSQNLKTHIKHYYSR